MVHQDSSQNVSENVEPCRAGRRRGDLSTALDDSTHAPSMHSTRMPGLATLCVLLSVWQCVAAADAPPNMVFVLAGARDAHGHGHSTASAVPRHSAHTLTHTQTHARTHCAHAHMRVVTFLVGSTVVPQRLAAHQNQRWAATPLLLPRRARRRPGLGRRGLQPHQVQPPVLPVELDLQPAAHAEP